MPGLKDERLAQMRIARRANQVQRELAYLKKLVTHATERFTEAEVAKLLWTAKRDGKHQGYTAGYRAAQRAAQRGVAA